MEKTNKKPAQARAAEPVRQRKISALSAGLAIIGCGSVGVQAQVPPDAGRIQQELERSRLPDALPTLPAKPVVEESPAPAASLPASVLFLVRDVNITRNTVFTSEELKALIQDFIGKELSFADLERAGEIITRHYRDHDYLVARAYVPVQEVRDGIVEITILEGTIERLDHPLGSEVRLKGAVVENTLRSVLPEHGLIRMGELERGLLLLNDIPGVQARSLVMPGSALGTSIITFDIKEGPPVSGSLDFDNQGNKFTDQFRFGATVNLNNPSGVGDFLGLRATYSTGVNFGRVVYQVPVGSSGFRLGGAYTGTNYKLCCDFEPLKASGEAQTVSLNASYPFLRGRNANFYGTASFDTKHFFNETIAGTVSDKQAKTLMLGISGDNSDFLGIGGLSNFGLNLSAGQLSLDGWAADRLADDASARTHGNYGKANYYLTRLQPLADSTSLYAGFSGQFASKNLDSSEKFALGGPLGVRSYPSGEAAGDEGLLLNLELRHYLQPNLQFVGFVDHGETRLHRNEWANWRGNNTRIGNRYGLSGVGLGLNWTSPGAFLMRASMAYPIGENPGRDVNGNDADNTKNRLRLLLQSVLFF